MYKIPLETEMPQIRIIMSANNIFSSEKALIIVSPYKREKNLLFFLLPAGIFESWENYETRTGTVMYT